MAKIRPEQLSANLKNSIAPVYLVSGDEPLLIQEACDNIRQAANSAGYTERELHHSEANFDWHLLNQNLNSLSLFSDKKVIEVRLSKAKIDQTASEIIRAYCEQANDETLLLLVMPKIDKRTQSAAWYKAIEQRGHTIAVWPVSAEALPRWIDARLRKAGINANSAAIDILCTKVEGNLLAAVQEIEKLKFVTSDNVIDSETMASAVMDSARYSVFTLVDRILVGDSRAAVRTLNGLQSEGVNPSTILWALHREVNTLYAVREAIDAGESFDSAARKSGVWDTRKGLIQAALKRLKLPQLQLTLRVVALTDRTIKGMAQGNEWNLLLDICLNLCGVQSLTRNTQKAALNS